MDNTQCSQKSRVILIWHLFSCVLFLICKCLMTLCVLVTLKKNCVLYIGKYCKLAACLVCTWDSIMSHHITFSIHHHLTYLQLLKKIYNNLTYLTILYYSTYYKITLANDQLDEQIFNTFITILYMYAFRAISCSSSGGQIVLI